MYTSTDWEITNGNGEDWKDGFCQNFQKFGRKKLNLKDKLKKTERKHALLSQYMWTIIEYYQLLINYFIKIKKYIYI